MLSIKHITEERINMETSILPIISWEVEKEMSVTVRVFVHKGVKGPFTYMHILCSPFLFITRNMHLYCLT